MARLGIAAVGRVDAGEAQAGLDFTKPLDLDDVVEQTSVLLG
jgi:hypothetical protein